MKNETRNKLLLALGFILVIAAMYLVWIFVPTEDKMGIVQRIFYLMVPFAWLSIMSFFVIFIASILYLAKRDSKWDIMAHSAGELGFIATSITLMVGILWMRPIWGTWWTWEPRLTATLVLWFIYLSYLMVRSFATEESRGARFAAVVGIIGFVDVPIVGMATTLWRVIHPPLIIFTGGVDPKMLFTVLTSVVAYTVLFIVLLNLKISIRKQQTELKRLKGLYTWI